jgi:RHO1 GDP-GTP exchange protein 1/2
LLGAVLKHTPDDSPDKHVLEQVIMLVRDFLGKVNTESGKTENRFNLVQLNQQLSFKPGEEVVRWGFLKKPLSFQLSFLIGSTADG